MKIGILALQGAFVEHKNVCEKIGLEVVLVKNGKDLEGVEGLIIPGGESTAMGLIAERTGFLKELKNFVHIKPTWGTCAGMILLADKALHQKQGGQVLLGGLDVTVDRNYFGSQVASFETFMSVPQLGEKPINAIFIRAPVIVEAGPSVEILAKLSDKEIVAVRQKNLLATAFHPELSSDFRWHEYFAKMIDESNKATKIQ